MNTEEHKTICCDSTWHVKSRANFRCDKCNSDVTIEVVLLTGAICEGKKKPPYLESL